jgi:hypothetical protein
VIPEIIETAPFQYYHPHHLNQVSHRVKAGNYLAQGGMLSMDVNKPPIRIKMIIKKNATNMALLLCYRIG